MEKFNYDIGKRISSICKKENISVRALEEMVGTSNGVINKIINNNGDVRCSIIAKILEIFPHYEAHWIITGLGSDIKPENTVVFEPDQKTTNLLLDRIEKLVIDNTRLKDENAKLRQSRQYNAESNLNQAAEP